MAWKCPWHVAMAGKPDFSHLSLQDKNCTAWGRYMESKGENLGEALWSVGKLWKSWGECPICQAEYPANIASHVRGKNHCNRLKEKLGWREPTREEFERYWQSWPLQSGRIFMFHHLTGEQKTEEGSAPAVAPHPLQQMAPAQPSAQPAPTALQPPPQPLPQTAQQPAPAPAAPSGDLLVEHKPGFRAAIQAIDGWKKHVEPSATLLDEELGKRTNRWDHPCSVCDGKAMTRGTLDHLRSKGHWTELWKKVSRNMPTPEEGARMDLSLKLPWVQSWEIPGGLAIYNHLTAAVKLELRSGGSCSSTGPATLAAPAAPAMQAPAAKAPAMQAPVQALIVEHKMDWFEAAKDSNSWWQHMEGPGQAVEENLSSHRSCLCKMCEAEMKEGAKAHLTSQDHRQALMSNLKSMCTAPPPPEVATKMESVYWVQRFGPFVFNHLTGALQPALPGHMSREVLPMTNNTPPVVPKAPAPVAPAAAAAPLPAAKASLLTFRNGINYREAMNDQGKWKKFMEEPTKNLDDNIYSIMVKFSGNCMVCEANLLGYNEHLCSAKHFKNMRGKFQNLPGEAEAADWSKPWVEKIETTNGSFYHNHLTGQQGFEKDIMGGATPAVPVAQPFPVAQPGPHPITVETQLAPAMPLMPRSPDSCVPPEQTQMRRPTRSEHFQFVCQMQPLVGVLQKQLDNMEGGDVWEGSDPTISCSICGGEPLDSFTEHLQSVEHYDKLQARLSDCMERMGYQTNAVRADFGWNQQVGEVVFSHLTLEQR